MPDGVGSRLPTFHAICLALGEAVFAEASIRSIYDSVVGVTLVTGYDRDWHGRPRTPDPLVDDILGRRYDPERKIDLIVSSETSEARTRNRAMDFADPSDRSRSVQSQHALDEDPPRPDYFLIVDADEIWEKQHLDGLREWASRDRLPVYRAPCVRYFRRWTTRVAGYEMAPVLYRRDVRGQYLRRWEAARWRRGVARFTPGLTARSRDRIRRIGDVPYEVARFHHGSYVGPRERIVAKLASFGHAHEVRPRWLEQTYDGWRIDMRDFHPVRGPNFPSADEVAVDELPPEIRDFAWPPGYLTE